MRAIFAALRVAARAVPRNGFLTYDAERLTRGAPGRLMDILGSGGVTRTSFAIGLVAAALGVVPALAADLGRFPPQPGFYPPPPVLRVYNWTGCYLGAQLGGAFANNKINGDFTTFVPASFNADGSFNPAGNLRTPLADNAGSTAVTLGGQGGCDLQVARTWVIGAQLDGVWTHLSGSQAINASAGLSEGGSHRPKRDRARTGQHPRDRHRSDRLRGQL